MTVSTIEEKIAQDVSKLARLINTHAPHDGRFELSIPGIYAFRLFRIPLPVLIVLFKSRVFALLPKVQRL